MEEFDEKILVGRYEWCQLPTLHLPAIKAKIDTGARTSAIHAFDINAFSKGRKRFVSFYIHPIQTNKNITVHCTAPIMDERAIMSSSGHKEQRYIIQTDIILGKHQWKIQLSLSNRDPLRFRLLLGREALAHRALIDPAHSCYQPHPVSRKKLISLYTGHH